MIRSSLVKSACVSIALSGFSPPQAGAIEMQGSESGGAVERRADLEGVYRPSRRDPSRASRRRLPSRRNLPRQARLPRRLRLPRRGYHGGGYRGGVYRGGYYGGWARPGGYWWPWRGDRGRRGRRGARRRRRRRLRWPAAGAWPVLVLHRPELPVRLLGRLLKPRRASPTVRPRPGASSPARRGRPGLGGLSTRGPSSTDMRSYSSTARINRCEEGLLANLIEQSESLQFVLHRVFEFGEAQSRPGAPERFIQL